MRNLSKQNRKKIFDLIKRDCTFVGSYDLEHSDESVLTYLPKPGTQIHKDVEGSCHKEPQDWKLG